MIYKVNIIICNEAGPCYMINEYDFNYKNCLVVAYWELGNPMKEKNAKINRNHYDSVTRIEQRDIYHIMKDLMQSIQSKDVNTILLIDEY